MKTSIQENQTFSPSGAHQLDLAEFVSIGPDGWECFSTECGITASCD
ncbi:MULTISPECIES: hypothetical protein [Bacillus cereus group]|uniref:Uncharacterized protein n=1 Tax=Bacillus cereus VD048 TaxID=1053226 RepID=J8HM18_BACCE|nr:MULTISPECIES: hypothetical protein [Bacillus cereus group]EJR26739.1 hypothetical protein IIG_05296 [Bacillus cereus VD048]EJR26935.1 hypothetical protein IIG_05065 [Bacillus cereus VD048]QWI78385.1 hypothetical protein JG486_30510 [Bacillus mycoides]